MQRSVSRKYENNKKGKEYLKTRNIIKSEKELLKVNHKLTNIRQNYLHQTTTEMVKTKPSYIVLEDLNVSGMMKNRHLSKAISSMNFNRFRNLLYQKSKNSFELRVADRFFPSSKKCCKCGNVKKTLELKERIYNCEVCGNEIDRDLNAAKNLEKLEVYRVL